LVSTVQGLDIQVNGLFKGSAIFTIDGRQQLLKVGKASVEGVLLLEANTKQAVVQVDGERRVMTLSRHISSEYSRSTKKELAIPRNRYDQYISKALVNGVSTEVLVDTGANTVAMSSLQARALKLDYLRGRPSVVRTASGESRAYSVLLHSVDVGGIQVNGVQAVVIEGSYPETVLLGMTFLKHVDLREKGDILYLQARF